MFCRDFALKMTKTETEGSRIRIVSETYNLIVVDLPCSPGFNNNQDGGDCLQRWTPRDDLVAG